MFPLTNTLYLLLYLIQLFVLPENMHGNIEIRYWKVFDSHQANFHSRNWQAFNCNTYLLRSPE